MKRLIIIFIFITGFIFPRNIDICALKIEFPENDNDATTGNGKFLLEKRADDIKQKEIFQDTRIIDPPPHNAEYFKDHIKAVSNYYKNVSGGEVNIRVNNSEIYPKNDRSYTLDSTMSYYHPTFKADSITEKRFNKLILHSINKADSAGVKFSNYDLVIIFHAGMGQIYDITLDPTPKDIKSAYMNKEDFEQRLGLEQGIPVENGNYFVKDAIILPETQNNFLYNNWEEVFGDESDPQKYRQFGLNGTFAMMMGYYLGLPSLGDTTGRAGAGRFGLMDQGSANLHSLVPSTPTAWSRMMMGWEKPITVDSYEKVSLPEVGSQADTTMIKVPINSEEYFLVENRNNFFRNDDNVDTLVNRRYESNQVKWKEKEISPPSLPYIGDSIGAEYSERGVLLSVPDYDYGIPGSGLLIWHVDESKVEQNLNTVVNRQDSLYVNLDRKNRGVDLEEGDGAQDFGYESSILTPQVEYGVSQDPWFRGNEMFFERNPKYEGKMEESVGFTPQTNPSTSSNMHSYTGIHIDSIGYPGDTMEFQIGWRDRFSLDIPSSFTARSVKSSNLSNSRFTVLAGDSLVVLGSNGRIIASADNYDFNNEQYKNLEMLINSAQDNIYIIFRDKNGIIAQKWNFTHSGAGDSGLELRDNITISGTQLTSNPVISSSSLIVGVKDNDKNYLIDINIDDMKVNNKVTMKESLQALSGGGSKIYYLKKGEIGEYNLSNMETTPVLQDSLINGSRLLQGELNNPQQDSLDFVFTNNDTIGIVLDKKGIDIKRLSSEHKSILSDIDGDGKVEIISALKEGKVLALNSQLTIESDFPVEIKQKISSPPLTIDNPKENSQKIVIEGNKGNIYVWNKLGKKTSNFPMTSRSANPEMSSLFRSDQGIILLGINNQGELDNNYIADNDITNRSWTNQGGDGSNSYSVSAYQEVEEEQQKSILNSERTYNWPNPVKETDKTNIRYYLNKNVERIEIKIYDLAGNKVTTLEDKEPVANEPNELVWSVKNIESGAYFAAVKAIGSNNSDKKIIKIMVIK